MATIQGVVLSITLSTQIKKQAGGSYDGWELVYKTQEGEVRSLQKPVQGLKFNQKLKGQLEALKVGDEFTAVTDKNAGGFIEVKSVEKGFGVAEYQPQKQEAPSPRDAKQAAYQQRDYESKEERTVKQRYIVRQSSIAQAIAALSVGAKTAPKSEDILALAKQFEDAVFGESKKEVAHSFEDFESDIPY